MTIRVPTEREERVRDLVRCREEFQREALKSRHYILKYLARRGLVYREMLDKRYVAGSGNGTETHAT